MSGAAPGQGPQDHDTTGGTVSCQRVLPGALAGDTVLEVHHLHLDPLPRLVCDARRFVRAHAPPLPDDTLDALLLLTSELVTNVVLHTTDLPSLSVTRTADGVRVTVADGSCTAPARRPPSNAATTGRGVHLLETLSDEWGWRPRPEGGKAVWFTVSGAGGPGVPVPRSSPSA